MGCVNDIDVSDNDGESDGMKFKGLCRMLWQGKGLKIMHRI